MKKTRCCLATGCVALAGQKDFFGANHYVLVMLTRSLKVGSGTFDVGSEEITRNAFSDTNERRLLNVGQASGLRSVSGRAAPPESTIFV